MENKIETQTPNQNTLSVFGQSSHFAFLYKKTEKLIAAIYMITDFVKDSEPLKWQIRERALELISTSISFTTVSLSERRELLKKYLSLSTEIVSLAEIARYGGIISEMNQSVLKREFEKLASTIEKEENKKANEETVILNPGFFDKSNEIESEKSDRVNDVLYRPQVEISKGHSLKSTPAVPAIDIPRSERKVEYLPKIQKPVDMKSDRKAIITKLLSKKSGLNIKDFSQAIHDCSEKTIQRELLAMVAAGVLKKEGERRWSTYSLSR